MVKKTAPEKTASKTKPAPKKTADGAESQNFPQNPMTIVTQYLKDLSFENPNAPEMLRQKEPPEVGIHINVDIHPMPDLFFAVDLLVKAEAHVQKNAQFVCELTYGALVQIHEALEEKFHKPLLMVEVPRLLFPFARNLLADATREGGFAPLFLQPIDFGELYRKQLEAEIQKGAENVPKH